MSSESTVVLPAQNSTSQEINPHGLFDVISFIERQHEYEIGGAEAPSGLFTTKQWWEFWEVGAKLSLKSGLWMSLTVPIFVGVLQRFIPIFGDTVPTLFDVIYAGCLSLGFPLVFSGFIAKSTALHHAGMSRKMVTAFMSGMTQGAVFKALLAFFVYHFLYIAVLTDENIINAALWLKRYRVNTEKLVSWAQWFMDARGILLDSAWWIVITTIIIVSLPYLTFYKTKRKIAKDVTDGKYKQPKD